jgi:predicted small lipoprotein YifL
MPRPAGLSGVPASVADAGEVPAGGPVGRPFPPLGGAMVIDCDACAARGPACADCVVSVLLGGPPAGLHTRSARSPAGEWGGPADQVELDGAEQAALAVLAGCGLVPPLRLVPVDRQMDRPRDRAVDRRGGRPEAPGDTAEREVS